MEPNGVQGVQVGGREPKALLMSDGSRLALEDEGPGGRADWMLLGDDAVHAVHNPLGTCTGAIHVYGGDFFDRDMSQWNPETLVPELDTRSPASFFEEANQRLGL